ncbi:MAG: endonuclease MutS2 [Anaerolineales bacterium]|nr:endonuclease MutS2 [Anaerolineales bacterium]MCW5855447.1 endonuclease MutS2 [Anaerolineales bacterium]
MDEKALQTLEFPKVLARLARHASFSLSVERAAELRPASSLAEAQHWLALTTEARQLVKARPQTSVGGARDLRAYLQAARRGQALAANELLDIKGTLVAGRTLARQLMDEVGERPLLAAIAEQMPSPSGVVDAVTKAISPRAEILDTASAKLSSIRSELGVVHERLLARMQKLLTSEPFAKALQEPIITQRDGRYVLPIKADSRVRAKGVVHDQSSSGATLFIEPLQVVELNNRWRELQLAERDEEKRILLELSALVAEQADAIAAVMQSLAELDLQLAKARYATELDAQPVELLSMQPAKGQNHPGVVVRLFNARHPLLDPASVVPLDIELFPENYCLVITGPNTGGKTVTLKTVGLLALMSQSGLHVPAAADSQLSYFDAVYADIGDEQSIEQSLSTFSGHITNIIRILKSADRRSLVIFDELGAGTDPQEGAALALALLDHLVKAGITTFVATHYPELKDYAHATQGVVNASVEFDLKTLAPTYHLVVGLPGRSNALAIATRLGLPKEIVETARGSIDPTELRSEGLLDEIHRERERSRQARARAEEAQRSAQALQADLAARLEGIEDERLSILEQVRKQAQAELDSLRDELGPLRAQLARARQPLQDVQVVQRELETLEEPLQAPVRRQAVPESAPDRPLRLGDMVQVRSLGHRGVVIALGEGEAEIQIGALRARAKLGDLELLPEQAAQANSERSWGGVQVLPESPGGELALRGQRYEDAFAQLDRYLDQAYAAGLASVRIVHGKGTGVLRDMVRKELNKRSYVERYDFALPHEGGEGVTVAHFRQ